MAILPILTAPNPLLKKVSSSVPFVNSEIRKLMDDMLQTMYHDEGVGLAAPQVGVLQRVIVLDLKKDDETERPNGFYPLYIANPEVVEKSEELVIAIEGCLSLPEQRIEMARPSEIKLKYLDYNNDMVELKTAGWLARAIQHEIDHLDGKLLIDYLSSVKKDSALRKLKKLKKHCL